MLHPSPSLLSLPQVWHVSVLTMDDPRAINANGPLTKQKLAWPKSRFFPVRGFESFGVPIRGAIHINLLPRCGGDFLLLLLRLTLLQRRGRARERGEKVFHPPLKWTLFFPFARRMNRRRAETESLQPPSLLHGEEQLFHGRFYCAQVFICFGCQNYRARYSPRGRKRFTLKYWPQC